MTDVCGVQTMAQNAFTLTAPAGRPSRGCGVPTKRTKLQAAAAALPRLHAAAALVEDVQTHSRLVSGLLVPYGEVGYASTDGQPIALRVPGPGRIVMPPAAETARVKLVDEHRDPPLSVGYAVALRDTEAGLRGQLFTARTADGDRVLAEMTADENGQRARDGFSVELVELMVSDTGETDEPTGLPIMDLESGRLHLVAAVVAPAWASAREDGLAASRTAHNERNNMLTEAQRARLAELLAMSDRTAELDTELRELLELANPGEGDGDGDGDGDTGTGDGDGDGDTGTGDGDTGTGSASRLAASRRRGPARAPRGTNTRRRSQRHTVRDLAAATAAVLGGRSRPELEAALSDITSTANIWTSQDEYGGELWEGVEYQRRFIPLCLPGELTARKGTGWRWVVKPAVGDYAGDKAAVPSNAPTTEAVSWTAARIAGAHDIDRSFFDFDDTEFIESYFHMMREDYARKSDDKARLAILAEAVAAGAGGASMFHAAAKVSSAVFDATGGQRPDYYLINSTDQLGLVDVTAMEVPAYLETFGITPEKFMPAVGVPAGTVVGGIRGAIKFRELSGSPIRVDALNIANGGVDGGVFGYWAAQEAFQGGIQKATFGA